MVDLGPVKASCRHVEAVEVRTLLDDELVAWWCEKCETQLPASWQLRPTLAELVASGTLSPDEVRRAVAREALRTRFGMP